VLPHTENGYLRKLEPIAAQRVSFVPHGYSDYTVLIDGREYKPDDVLHFVYNPDPLYPWKGQGVKVSIRNVAHDLAQASATKRGFMESKWKPSFIVRVDGMTDALASPKGREALLKEYIETEEAGTPWIIPGEQMNIETVKPLTLKDLAISESVELDKRTVAALFGEPAFLLGVGDYSQKQWHQFVQNKISSIALIIAQEMTRKLIFSPDWYLRFNIMSLMDWDIQTIANVMCTYGDRGYVDGNEARDKIGFSPREGLDELRILENYIPAAMSGQQSKLVGQENTVKTEGDE
jgi:HK97 family phage portal protein